MTAPPRIVLGVTVDTSMILMRGLPEYLRDQGWEVHLVSAPGPQLERYSAIDGISTHAIPMRRQPSVLADVRALLAWTRMLRRVRPVVTSVGTPKAALLGGIAAALTRVPARVYVLRGLRLETTQGLGRKVLAVLERVAAASAHTVVAVSPSLRDLYLSLKLAPTNKVITIGSGSSNGVDLAAHRIESLDPEALASARSLTEARPGVPVIGFVGRLTADKGLAMLAQALAELERRGVVHQLLVVGGIDDDSGEQLADEIARVTAAAVVTGHLSDPRALYHCMDVLCLPTYREGFPNVVLEAAASGVPTITTTATGAIDSVVDGETGLVVPVGSALALADALETLVDDPELARDMGDRARRRVEAEFDRQVVWAGWEQLYRRSIEVER